MGQLAQFYCRTKNFTSFSVLRPIKRYLFQFASIVHLNVLKVVCNEQYWLEFTMIKISKVQVHVFSYIYMIIPTFLFWACACKKNYSVTCEIIKPCIQGACTYKYVVLF